MAQRGIVAAVLVLVGLCAGCTADVSTGGVSQDAARLAQELIIADTHIDVPYRLEDSPEDIGQQTEGGDFDFPRGRAGGLDVPFFSIYVPARFQLNGARDYADKLIDGVETIVTAHPDKFSIVDSVEAARNAVGQGRMAIALGMENGAPIEGDLDNVRHFHERGIRYITLAHSENNHICDSSYAAERRWNGLSPFGRQLVKEMNRVGVMIDISHVSDAAFDQVIELTQAPVIASHSSCRHFTPDWERNMSDEMIRKLADKGGVIQINFGSSFLSDDYRRARSKHWEEIGDYLDEHDIDEGSPEAVEFTRRYLGERPLPYAKLSDVVAHIDHVVKLVGIDHVGLGSDFDGVGDSLPVGLKDVSDYPNLIEALLEAGYTPDHIAKICSGNIFRVWSEVERLATEG